MVSSGTNNPFLHVMSHNNTEEGLTMTNGTFRGTSMRNSASNVTDKAMVVNNCESAAM